MSHVIVVAGWLMGKLILVVLCAVGATFVALGVGVFILYELIPGRWLVARVSPGLLLNWLMTLAIVVGLLATWWVL